MPRAAADGVHDLPLQHELSIANAYAHIGLLVENIFAIYSAGDGHSQAQTAQEWKTQVTSVVSLAKLRRWGPRAASDIAQRIGAVEQLLEHRERAHEALFLAAHVLVRSRLSCLSISCSFADARANLCPQPSTDVLLHHAHLHAQTAEERDTTYRGLLGDLVLLYSESNKSNHASPQHKSDEATTLFEAIQSRTTDSAQRLFHQLSPEQQQTAVDTTRASVAHSCDMLHSTGELPSATLLVRSSSLSLEPACSSSADRSPLSSLHAGSAALQPFEAAPSRRRPAFLAWLTGALLLLLRLSCLL